MKKAAKIRVLLVDDHFVVRMGLAGAINAEPDMTVVAECGSGEQAIELFGRHAPDVTVMDWRLPGMSGVQATEAIREESPQARVVLLTVYEGEEDVFRAVQVGVAAYLPKSAERAELLAAIRTVHLGQTYFPPAIAAKLAARQERPELSSREREVLHWVVLGHTNREIARQLGIAEVTVKLHVGSVLQKLGARDRTEASTLAIQRGIVHLE
jgi:DNA-binding NarL/FixJ family response regulator